MYGVLFQLNCATIVPRIIVLGLGFMKKLLNVLFLSMFLMISNNTEVNAKKYKVNDVVETKFTINKKFQINLPKGKWIIAQSSSRNYYGLTSKIYALVRLENNSIVEYIEIAEMKTAGIYEDIVNQAIYEVLFKNKYDGCYERPEYSFLKVFKKGSTHNCFRVRHSDVYKEIYDPDDPETSNGQMKLWIKKNNIQLPKVALSSFHAYFSRLSAGKWYLLAHTVDPRILDAPENKDINESTSEYHLNNIDNHPEYKKIMENWLSISAKRHIDFENSINVLKKHRLNLNELSPN